MKWLKWVNLLMLGLGILTAESLYHYRVPPRPVMTVVLHEDNVERFFPIFSINCDTSTRCEVRNVSSQMQHISVEFAFDPPGSPQGKCSATLPSGDSLNCSMRQSFYYLYGEPIRPYIRLEDQESLLGLSIWYQLLLVITSTLGSLGLGRDTHWAIITYIFSVWIGLNAVAALERRRENTTRRIEGATFRSYFLSAINLIVFMAAAVPTFYMLNIFIQASGIVLD
ncbi:MAG: hypothetical protein AAF633_09735 [Chloroflexota bacterium]